MDYASFFKGKKITQVGLGLLGRGIGDARFLAQMGADLTVTDLKTADELRPALEQLKEFKNIRYTLGRHDVADFRDRDLVINGPAVPLSSPYIAEARANGIPLTMSTALFTRFARGMGATIVGVTGTRGKSTTTELIAHIAKTAGASVLLGGNIQGVSTLAQLPSVMPGMLAVLELDSWQLQGFRDEHISPNIAVFTNLYADHLNYYQGDMGTYLQDKAQIFLNQRPEDTIILGEHVASLVQRTYSGRIPGQLSIAHSTDLPADWKLALVGEHNKENASCALAAARALHIDDTLTRAAMENFAGVAGRLQFVREIDGVRVYNDTTATTPEATIAGLNALDPEGKKNIALIVGGADKGLDMSELIPAIRAHANHVTLLMGTGTSRIAHEFPEAKMCGSLKEALADAFAGAQKGGTVLLSPAFASFGMFTNEYDRGAQFMELIAQL